ncbi:unnamed protein product [Rotaria magnacalcarata]
MSSIQVTILYFGRLRELVGTSSEKLDFDPSISYTSQTILARIIENRPILKSFLISNCFRLAVNQEYLPESDFVKFNKQSITRDNFEGRRVTRLSYEAYEPMALKELNRLCDDARRKFVNIEHIAISHRLGDVPISDISVAIYVSGPHRRDVLDAVSFLIEQLKANIPIWKKEFYEDSNDNNKNNNSNDNNSNISTSSYSWKENR